MSMTETYSWQSPLHTRPQLSTNQIFIINLVNLQPHYLHPTELVFWHQRRLLPFEDAVNCLMADQSRRCHPTKLFLCYETVTVLVKQSKTTIKVFRLFRYCRHDKLCFAPKCHQCDFLPVKVAGRICLPDCKTKINIFSIRMKLMYCFNWHTQSNAFLST